MKTPTLLFCVLLPLGLGACATANVPGAVSAPVPAQWSAPLPPQAHPAATPGLPEKPHHGNLTDLTQWWQQQGDPLLVELIAAAQAVSPTMATARSRFAGLLPPMSDWPEPKRNGTMPGCRWRLKWRISITACAVATSWRR